MVNKLFEYLWLLDKANCLWIIWLTAMQTPFYTNSSRCAHKTPDCGPSESAAGVKQAELRVPPSYNLQAHQFTERSNYKEAWGQQQHTV